MPELLVEAVANHHKPVIKPKPALSAIVHIADVIALDVGHNQLDWRLRSDPRVIVREGVNARTLTERDVPHRVDIVTIDVAFISLTYILPEVPKVLDLTKETEATKSLYGIGEEGLALCGMDDAGEMSALYLDRMKPLIQDGVALVLR